MALRNPRAQSLEPEKFLYARNQILKRFRYSEASANIFNIGDCFIYKNYFRFLALFLIGVNNALPIPLTGSTLSIWLTEMGFDRASIGLFSLSHLPFSLRLLWIPLIESFGKRKFWASATLFAIAVTMVAMGLCDYSRYPIVIPISISFISFALGGFYVTGLSYELESIDQALYSVGSACITSGYRIGLCGAGAGALYLSALCNWQVTYCFFAALISLTAFYILLQPEPYKSLEVRAERKARVSQYRSRSEGLFQEMVVHPCKGFFLNPQWKVLISLILCFKSGNQLMKSMEGPFYLSLGMSKGEIAAIVKLWGLAATISGSTLGAFFFKGKDHCDSLKLVSYLNTLTLACFCLLAIAGNNSIILYGAIALEHFLGGLAMSTFIFFLWRICDKQFAAIQYALLWSIYSVKGDLLSCWGGFISSRMEWHSFFSLAFGLALAAALSISFLIDSIPTLQKAPRVQS